MWIRAAGLYLVSAGLVTWPLVIQLTSHLGALEGAGDPFLNLWILGWGMDAWLADPLAVLSGRAFDANIFHPVEGALTFSDHLLLQSLGMTPLYAVTGNLVLCYNVLLLLSIAASGLAMHVLVRSVTGSTAAAFVAGLAWACWPYRTAHLLHLQLQSLYFLPLALWALHRVVAARRWRDVLWLAAFAALQAISSVYYGVMTAIALATAAAVLAVATGQWRSASLWSRLAASAVIGAVLIAPVAWPYWRTQQREGFGRNLFEAAAHAASAQSYTQVPPDNLVYGRTGLMAPRAPAAGARDRRHVEHQMFPGMIISALALAGLWRARRSDARPLAASAAALVVAGVVLSLGPDGVRPVYAWVADVVFGFQAIRAPARFAVVAMAGLCLLGGLAVPRIGLRGQMVAALAALMMFEYANAPLAFVPAPATSTEAGRWLRAAPSPGAVLYLPLVLDRENSVFMVQSLEHKRPIVNGYSGQRPSFFTSFVDALVDPASIEARAVLKDAAVRYVVSPTSIEGAGDPSSPFLERARVAEGVIYELIWTPESEAALDAEEVAAPPPPGPLPFVAGETATYQAEWLSGPLDIPAGTVTLRVLARDAAGAPAEPGWVFEATIDTAGWVSRFYEAHDRFETRADAQLKPLTHTRTIREGRRAVDNAYLFDHDARRVRSGSTLAEASSAGAMALPLSAGSLDTLTALWYIRALPLAPGLTAVLPVNDGRRGLVVTVRVGGREQIEVDGRSEDVFRVEPRIVARVERRQPIDATIWVSADRRRLPLVADIAAGFGRIRLKLVDYRP